MYLQLTFIFCHQPASILSYLHKKSNRSCNYKCTDLNKVPPAVFFIPSINKPPSKYNNKLYRSASRIRPIKTLQVCLAIFPVDEHAALEREERERKGGREKERERERDRASNKMTHTHTHTKNRPHLTGSADSSLLFTACKTHLTARRVRVSVFVCVCGPRDG